MKLSENKSIDFVLRPLRVFVTLTSMIAVFSVSVGCVSSGDTNSLQLGTAKSTATRPTPRPQPPESNPTPVPNPTPPPPSTPITTLTRNGEFLVSDQNNHNFAINIPVANGTDVKRVTVDVDVFVSNWDPTNPGGYHCLFWMQRGTWPNPFRWENSVVGYMNLRGPSYNGGRMTLETTVSGNYNQGQTYSATLGRWYHLSYEINSDGFAKYQWKYNGNTELEKTVTLAAIPIQITNGGFFIQFGTQIADEGPEAKTYGWRFANLNLRIY